MIYFFINSSRPRWDFMGVLELDLDHAFEITRDTGLNNFD